MPNFKQSHYYKLKFLTDWRSSELLFAYEPTLINDYNKIINALMDPLPSLSPKVNPDVSLFGYFTHVDKTKFLDTGYSELKDFFYIKLSKIDTENYKLEFVVKNEEYDIADYKARYNQAMREHYILQHIKFKKLLDNIEDHAIKRDKNYLFDSFRLSNEMRLKSFLKELEVEKMRLKLEVASLRLKKKEANKELKIKKANKKVVIDNLLYSNLPYDEIFSLENKLIETTKKLEYITNRLENTTRKKESKKETIKIKENIEYHYFFKDKCYQNYQDQDSLTSLKRFRNCLLSQDIFYKDKSDLGLGNFDEDNQFFLFISKDEIEKEIEDNIANHKKIISSKLTTIRKKIDNRMEITKKQDFIDFEYLGSNYSNKYKIIELLKYFILFYFLSFIFNTIFYFFSIRKLKNG
ncbi:hypothetical protein N8815_02040 [Candidatus Pelagibacter sp.]|nr:hypothetical protein [Candidatus Pelagibacter sp.]